MSGMRTTMPSSAAIARAVDAELVADACGDGQCPRRVHLHAVGGVQDESPVAELVAESLDHESRVGRHVPGDLALLGEERDQVARGAFVEAAGRDPGGSRSASARVRELARVRADGSAELGRAADAVALPERDAAGLAERGRDEHPVVRDVFDAPARRAEREDVADPRLVDHLFVELADAGGLLADHEDAEQASVGDRAAARDGEALRPGATGERAVHAVPDDARSQLGELVGRVLAAEQVEGRVVGGARQRRERRAASHGVEPLVGVDLVERDGGDGLLGQHVEGVRRAPELFDQPLDHALGGDGGVDQVGPVLREQHAARHLADLVPGAADALQPARDRWRRLDLDHEVDGAHVDAELERARRDDAAQAAALEVVFDDRALVFADGAVVGPGEERLGARRSARSRPSAGPGHRRRRPD